MGAGRSLARWPPLGMVMPCGLLLLLLPLLHRNLRRLVVFMGHFVIFHVRFVCHVRLEISKSHA